jgi:hypothetical protein
VRAIDDEIAKTALRTAVARGIDISIYDGTRVIHARGPNNLKPS